MFISNKDSFSIFVKQLRSLDLFTSWLSLFKDIVVKNKIDEEFVRFAINKEGALNLEIGNRVVFSYREYKRRKTINIGFYFHTTDLSEIPPPDKSHTFDSNDYTWASYRINKWSDVDIELKKLTEQAISTYYQKIKDKNLHQIYKNFQNSLPIVVKEFYNQPNISTWLQNLEIVSTSDKITEIITEYKNKLRNEGLKEELYKFELVKENLNKPNPESEDFEKEIKSIDFSNLAYYQTRGTLHHVASEKSEELRVVFKHLLNEDRQLLERVSNFTEEFKTIYTSVAGEEWANQHHQDERAISIYLTYHNPEKFTFYQNTYYENLCKYLLLDSKKVKEKYSHYIDLITDIGKNFLSKDSEFLGLKKNILLNNHYSDPNNLLFAQDIVFQYFSDKKETSQNEKLNSQINEKLNDENSMNNKLNQILYGPPGTGKTYHTVDLAVKIAASDRYLKADHAANKVVFDELVKSEQIVFSTFHQSMSYEDFVEGIKPLEPEKEGDQIIYKVVDGIFKQVCVNAKTPNQNGFEQAYEMFIEKHGDNDELIKLKTTSNKEFGIKFNRNNNLNLHTGESLVKQGVLTRENLKKQINGEDMFEGWNGYFKSVIEFLKSEFNYSENDSTSKPYILIIDEINRGNVSQIFGELITLIEEDKRAGNKEVIEITLPYSKERFSVPNNLYIIGTMNTADRSVEALDSALRRRFSFQEMMPKPELLKEINWNGFEVSEILETINNRIEVLIDRDHTIGHSYFMGLEMKENKEGALKSIFKDKIIPLLQEYFFNDYGKIQLVLGNVFIEEEKKKVQFAIANNEIDKSDYEEKVIYKITADYDLERALSALIGKEEV